MWRVLVGVICFFPLSAHAAQREYVSAWFVDSLIKVFPDTPAATSKLEPTLISARNGHASLQVALRSESNRQLMLHVRSEEHTSELQSQSNLVCRLLLEKKKNKREHDT